MNQLCTKSCVPCEGGIPALTLQEATELHRQVPEWVISEDGKQIRREYAFKDYYRTMAFVNAVAWVAHVEDHHPELAVSYNRCTVRFNTHSVGGISVNDFICAAKVDALLP